MDELQKYLDNRLQNFKQSCDNWLTDYKQALHSQHNQFLITKIKEAEESIEKGKSEYVQMFKDSMTDLKKRREASPEIMKKALDMWEDSLKKQLDSNLSFVEKTWRSFIENCKAQIK